MRPFALLLLIAVFAGLLPAGGLHTPVAEASPARPAVATPTGRLVLGGVAVGGQLRLLGYGFVPNQSVALRLVRPNGAQAASLGTAQTSATGLLSRMTMALPAGTAAGPYAVEALNLGATAVVLARTELQVWAAPTVELVPTSGPPGTEVRVTVRNLVPGSLRLDFAGAPVLGPLPTKGGVYQGSFIVPDDRGVAPDAVATVAASNIVGDRLVGRDTARFVMRAGSGRPTFTLSGVAVAPPKLRRGEPFTITGKIVPAPAGAYANVRLAPYWARRGGASLPLRGTASTIAPDGSFTVTGSVPSILAGDAIIARAGDRVGISLVPESGPSVSHELLANLEASLNIPFSVQVRKDKPGAPDDKQPVPNAPAGSVIVDIEPVGSMGLLPEEISNSLSLSDGSFVLDMATINSILGGQQLSEEIGYLNDRVNGCFIAVPNIPRWEWGLDVEETILLSNSDIGIFQLPGLPALPGAPLAPTQAQGPPGQLDPGEVLVQVFKVTVDAAQVLDTTVSPTQKGYGVVDDENKAVATVRYFVHIPSQGRSFEIGTDGNTATQVAYPAPIDLPPLPAGWGTSFSVGELRFSGATVPPGTSELGRFYSFRSPDNPALYGSITFAPSEPLSLTVRLNSSLPAAQSANQNVYFEFRGQDYLASKVQVYQGGSRCQSPGPPQPITEHMASVPVPGNQILPGTYPLKVKLAPGAGGKVLRTLSLKFEDYRPYTTWFLDPQTTQRRVQWRPFDSRLTAVPEPSSAGVGGSMPHAGQQDSSLGLSAEVTTVLNRYGLEQTLATNGGIASQAMNNAGATLGFDGAPGPQSIAGDPAAEALSASADTGASQAAPLLAPRLSLGIQSQPQYDEQVSILDTGYIPITGFAYGIPGIASISLSIDFRVQATAAYGITADLGINTLLDSNVAVRIKAEIDILLGLASAEIAFIPNVGVQIPSQFRWAASPIDVGKCFYYALDVSWTIDALWGAVDVADGSTTIFDGDTPNGCRQNLPSALAAQAGADQPMPQANPALATDGLGRVLRVWRDAAGQIVSSELVNGVWQVAQPVTVQGRHGDPQVAFIAPGRAVAVWSKSGLSAAPTTGMSLADILRQQHLAFAIWENGAWSAPQDLTAPATGDGKVALAACQAGASGCPAGGAVTAAWVRDAAGDVAQRQFRIFTATYQGGAWGAPQPVDPASTAADAEPLVLYRAAQPLVLWVRDADRDINTLGDRRLAMRDLSAAAVVVPAELPAGITRPGAALDAAGNLQLAFTVARQQDGPFSNRQALHRAVGACAAGVSCGWSVEEQHDAIGRSLFAESPVVTVDDAGAVVVTYRAMGFSPLAQGGQPLSQVPETPGTLTGSGELAQLELPAALGTTPLPAYLTSDGATNWRPAAVYDPMLNSVIALAVKGPGQAVAAADGPAEEAAALAGDDPAIVSAIAPRQPDFAVAGVTLGERGTDGLPLSVSVRVHNRGDDWAAAGTPPLVVKATWDDAPGVGQPAGQASLGELRAGAVAEVRLELKAPQDRVNRQRALVISVNPGGVIAEPAAGDNVRRIMVGGLPTPADVQGTARAGGASAYLTWREAGDSRVVGYRVYRLDAGGGRAPAGSSYAAGWLDPMAEPGQTYRYVVTSFGADMVESAPSAPVTITVGEPRTGAGPGPMLQSVYLPLVLR